MNFASGDRLVPFLPAAFAADNGRLARFERDARVLASLNHPRDSGSFSIASGTNCPFRHELRPMRLTLDTSL